VPGLASGLVRTVKIKADEGLQLTGDEWGDPSHPAVLMLHGAGQNRHAWKGSAAALSEACYFVLTLDARGHGDSDWSPSQSYDSDHVAADVHMVLERFDHRPAVVGASMGGMASLAAQRLADHQLYAALVLVDITPHFDVRGAQRIIDFMSGNPEGFADLDAAADAIAAYNPHRPRPKDVSGLARVLRQRDDGRWIWRWDPAYITSKPGFGNGAETEMVQHMERTSDQMLEGARAVKAPKLLVRGGQSDLVTPEAVERFLTAVPDSEFVDVAGTGHMVAGDDNDAFTTAVTEFLGRHHPA
jgi:pimeloyl-ACP methyl ester carboxylesterase